MPRRRSKHADLLTITADLCRDLRAGYHLDDYEQHNRVKWLAMLAGKSIEEVERNIRQAAAQTGLTV